MYKTGGSTLCHRKFRLDLAWDLMISGLREEQDMLMKHIIVLSLAAVAASQKLDNCTITLNFPATEIRDNTEAIDCVFPELSHNDCYSRFNSLRVAFRAPPNSYSETTTCNYDLISSTQLSVTDFLNIPAVCSMLGGKAVYATWNECISSE
ncbi:hypothetical protein BGX27_007471 [Mortierella sp. AM989]|nr:hypothetical protein BGX27_007471 [Mortierella sp. AM989]